MNCYLHPDREAIGTCTSCGRFICSEDAIEMQGRLVCRECLSTGRASTKSQSDKDPNTAYIIELVGGFFGLLGLGYFYVGRTSDGIIRLISWIIYDLIAGVTISLLLTVLVGFLCIPIQLVIQIAIPLWSASALKKQLLAQPTEMVLATHPLIAGPTSIPSQTLADVSKAQSPEADVLSEVNEVNNNREDPSA